FPNRDLVRVDPGIARVLPDLLVLALEVRIVGSMAALAQAPLCTVRLLPDGSLQELAVAPRGYVRGLVAKSLVAAIVVLAPQPRLLWPRHRAPLLGYGLTRRKAAVRGATSD